MKVVLVRHTSVAVERGVCYGRTDVPLAETFGEEADSVKRRLCAYRFDRIFTSPLSRCVNLARFCGFSNPVTDDRLLEMNFGAWEMKRFDDIEDSRLKEWYDDYMNVAPTGGESSMEQCVRVKSFFEYLSATGSCDDTVAVFTHGGVMIHAMVCYGGMSYDEAFASQPGYGAIIELHI